MLRQQRLCVGPILLRAIECLRVRIELRVQPHEDLHIVVLIPGELAHVLPLEVRQLAIQIVNVALGVLELTSEEVCCALCHLFPRLEIFFQQHRREFVADLLCLPRISGREVHVESRHIALSRPFLSAGCHAQFAFDRFDRDVLSNVVNHVVQVLAALREPQPINHRLQPVPAQHLLL